MLLHCRAYHIPMTCVLVMFVFILTNHALTRAEKVRQFSVINVYKNCVFMMLIVINVYKNCVFMMLIVINVYKNCVFMILTKNIPIHKSAMTILHKKHNIVTVNYSDKQYVYDKSSTSAPLAIIVNSKALSTKIFLV